MITQVKIIIQTRIIVITLRVVQMSGQIIILLLIEMTLS